MSENNVDLSGLDLRVLRSSEPHQALSSWPDNADSITWALLKPWQPITEATQTQVPEIHFVES